MPQFFALLATALVALAGGALAVRFFWRLPWPRAFFYAGIFVGGFLLFWGLGLWQGASRHSWGALTPVFVLLLGVCWLAVKFSPRIMAFLARQVRRMQGR